MRLVIIPLLFTLLLLFIGCISRTRWSDINLYDSLRQVNTGGLKLHGVYCTNRSTSTPDTNDSTLVCFMLHSNGVLRNLHGNFFRETMLSTIEGLIWFQKDRFVTYDWGFFKVSDSRLYIQRFAEARPHQYIVIDETWQIDNDSTLTRPFSLYSYSKEAMVDTVEKYNFYWTEKKLDSTSFVLKNKEKLDRTLSRVRSHRE